MKGEFLPCSNSDGAPVDSERIHAQHDEVPRNVHPFGTGALDSFDVGGSRHRIGKTGTCATLSN